MLIFEGPDLVGKTTAAQKAVLMVHNQRPVVYRHFTKLPAMWKYPQSYFPHIAANVVQDRFHMSAPVYDEIAKRGMRLPPHLYHVVDTACRRVGAYNLVICAENGDVIRELYDRVGRPEMYTVEKVVAVNELYLALAKNNGRAMIGGVMFKCDVDDYHIMRNANDFVSERWIEAQAEKWLKRAELYEYQSKKMEDRF